MLVPYSKSFFPLAGIRSQPTLEQCSFQNKNACCAQNIVILVINCCNLYICLQTNQMFEEFFVQVKPFSLSCMFYQYKETTYNTVSWNFTVHQYTVNIQISIGLTFNNVTNRAISRKKGLHISYHIYTIFMSLITIEICLFLEFPYYYNIHTHLLNPLFLMQVFLHA